MVSYDRSLAVAGADAIDRPWTLAEGCHYRLLQPFD
jgi:hypothetical protein